MSKKLLFSLAAGGAAFVGAGYLVTQHIVADNYAAADHRIVMEGRASEIQTLDRMTYTHAGDVGVAIAAFNDAHPHSSAQQRGEFVKQVIGEAEDQIQASECKSYRAHQNFLQKFPDYPQAGLMKPQYPATVCG
jgi:hypothetical protein